MALLMPDEVEKKKQEAALVDTRSPEEAVTSLLAPVMPKTPWEKMQEEHGTGGSIMRILGTGLSGGILGDALMPELTKAGQDRYDAELAAYGDQVEAYNMANALSGIDPENITPAHIALAHQYGGSSLSEYYTDQYSAQRAEVGTDHAVAEMAGVPYAQWIQRSPEQKRADRNYYQSQNGDGTYFDAQLQAEGKAPDQLQAAKESESFGTATGTQYGDDRALITGSRGRILAKDQQLDSLQGIRDNLSDPNATGVTGWPRVVRDFLKANNYTDGAMDAEMATGVVDLISQATFGALSQSELNLLKGGLMDPTKSMAYNLGTLDKAMDRLRDEKDSILTGAQGAAERYRGWEGQDDYDQLFEDDWLYQNIGDGSRVPSIPAYGNKEEVTFSDYVEYRKSQKGPFDPPLSRDELIIGFKELRDESEAEYNAMIEKQEADREAAERARLGLDRPWPTVKQ